ncbi:hypothetical protein WOLCODRAFT_165079 [Wolfiporia cocos MD-104 SS10]|uniref:Uncharacterized protein n=1 Tax=Wolfiporia cocos (strain MD-104) TaxID=742152 RepID=A0A2H3JWI7_WOLCO|nr:hypothetical protein WOLCODRAFT_165079 [Wolfiporia cocos MD-104 SS10]
MRSVSSFITARTLAILTHMNMQHSVPARPRLKWNGHGTPPQLSVHRLLRSRPSLCCAPLVKAHALRARRLFSVSTIVTAHKCDAVLRCVSSSDRRRSPMLPEDTRPSILDVVSVHDEIRYQLSRPIALVDFLEFIAAPTRRLPETFLAAT